MSVHSAAILAVWSVLLVVIGALTAYLALASRLRRPAAQPLRLDPTDYDLDGPVIDLKAA
jgi:hypothetical protein